MRYDDPLHDQHVEARDAYRHGANHFGPDRPSLAELLQDNEDAEREYLAGAVCPGCGDRYPSTSRFVDHVDQCGDRDQDRNDGVRSWLIGATVIALGTAAMFHRELASLFGVA